MHPTIVLFCLLGASLSLYLDKARNDRRERNEKLQK